MRKIGNKKKIFLILGSILLTFVMLEVILNFCAYFYALHTLPRHKFDRISTDVYYILCLGDSFTYGIGTDFENSYPVQLEKILNLSNSEKKIKVFNLGIPGANSSIVLQELEDVLNKVHPDMVIISAGLNDFWNIEYALSNYKLGFFNINHKLWISKLKIIKLFNIFIENIRQNRSSLRDLNKSEKLNIEIEKARNFKRNKEHKKAIDILSECFLRYPDNKIVQTELTDACIQQKNIKKSIECYHFLLKSFPKNFYLLTQLSNSYKHQAGIHLSNQQFYQAIASYKKATFFYDQNKGFLDSYLDGQKIFSAQAQQKEAHFKKLAGENIKNSSFENIWFFDKQIMNFNKYMRLKILKDNYEEYVNICKKNNIALVFSGYPFGELEIIEEMSNIHNIPFVDQNKEFNDILKVYEFEQLFISKQDKHCTSFGYLMMANNLARMVLKIVNSDR